MLYKKIHRQYLRQLWKGRKFKYDGEVYEVTRKPYIEGSNIRTCCWRLISISGPYLGRLRYKNCITFLD